MPHSFVAMAYLCVRVCWSPVHTCHARKRRLHVTHTTWRAPTTMAAARCGSLARGRAHLHPPPAPATCGLAQDVRVWARVGQGALVRPQHPGTRPPPPPPQTTLAMCARHTHTHLCAAVVFFGGRPARGGRQVAETGFQKRTSSLVCETKKAFTGVLTSGFDCVCFAPRWNTSATPLAKNVCCLPRTHPPSPSCPLRRLHPAPPRRTPAPHPSRPWLLRRQARRP